MAFWIEYDVYLDILIALVLIVVLFKSSKSILFHWLVIFYAIRAEDILKGILVPIVLKSFVVVWF
ncbi:MAG: hypothetical protein LBG48_02295 [Rickettsiales bacterium]|jgi:hypothetical protein|nr:hypothetical protein [Rickettsiales bacterium]